MESRIKIEYNQKRTAQIIDGEEVGWTIGPGDDTGFPTSSVVYVKSTGSDANDGLTEPNAVKSMHVAVHKAVAGGLDNIIVVDSAEYSGTVDLKGKTAWFKNDATIGRVSLDTGGQDYSAGVNTETTPEILTSEGIFQAVLITEDSGAGRCDLKIIKNRTQENTNDLSGDITISSEIEPAAFHDRLDPRFCVKSILHYDSDNLFCFVLSYGIRSDSALTTDLEYIIYKYKINADLSVTKQCEFTIDNYLVQLRKSPTYATEIVFYSILIRKILATYEDIDGKHYALFHCTGKKTTHSDGFNTSTKPGGLKRFSHYYGLSEPYNFEQRYFEFLGLDGSSTGTETGPPSEEEGHYLYSEDDTDSFRRLIPDFNGSQSSPFTYNNRILTEAIYKNGVPFWPLPYRYTLSPPNSTNFTIDTSQIYTGGVSGIKLFNEIKNILSGTNFNLKSEIGLFLIGQGLSVSEFYSNKVHAEKMNNFIPDHENPSVADAGYFSKIPRFETSYTIANSSEATVWDTPIDYIDYKIIDTDLPIISSAGLDSEPIFHNGTVENIVEDATYPRSILHEGTLNRSQVSGLSQDFPSCAVLRGAGERNIIDSLKLGIGSDDVANVIKNNQIVNCERAAGLATVKHCTIHKCVYALEGASVVEDSIIAYCTGQYINETGVPMTITRSVIREALNQNLVPVDSVLTLVKIGDPFFKSAVQPFDLHLKSIFGNYPVSSPAIGLSLTPSIHNAAIMREAGAYDDFYAAAETWESLTIDAPWTLPTTAEREVSSNKLADGRQTVGALSSPSAVFRLRWLALTSQAIQAIQSLIWADSMKVRIYFNPVSKPDVYLEGYIEPKTKLGPPVAPVVNVAEGVEMTFKAQLPAGDLHGYL